MTHIEPTEAYVSVWLPGTIGPVPAGRLWKDGDRYAFAYAEDYLERHDAIAIYEPELPLRPGAITPSASFDLASCLRDAAPDAWGRRVMSHRLAENAGHDIEFDELTVLLHTGMDRIGALEVHSEPVAPQPAGNTASIEELCEAAWLVERRETVPMALRHTLQNSAVGGARPKALFEDGTRKFIAKFPTTLDSYNVIKAEFVAMRLAECCGLTVAPVELTRSTRGDVLLVERFDRIQNGKGWERIPMVSALTVLGLSEMEARYASYADLAAIARSQRFSSGAAQKEIFGRMVFNVLAGNTDDHARNHSMFWDGERLTLTPAYDICPQARNGREANQAMAIHGADRRSRLETCRAAAEDFGLADEEARDLIAAQIETIRSRWNEICVEAEMTTEERHSLWGRQFLNDFAFEDYADRALTPIQIAT